MEKFSLGGFPNNKELFVQTDSELCGNFGDKKIFPHKPMVILEEVRNAAEKSLSKRKRYVMKQYNKEKEENVKRMREDLKIFPSLQEIHEGIKQMNGKENSEKRFIHQRN